MRLSPFLAITVCFLLYGQSTLLQAATSYAKISTSLGDIWVELDDAKAPKAVKQFKEFVRDDVYDKTTFHLANGDCIAGGKPGPKAKGYSSNGNFSSTKAPAGEFEVSGDRGAIGFSRTVGSCNPDKTNNSTQFFIQFKNSPSGGKDFTMFGKVVAGMDIVDKINSHFAQPNAAPVEMSVRISANPPAA